MEKKGETKHFRTTQNASISLVDYFKSPNDLVHETQVVLYPCAGGVGLAHTC